MPNAKQHNSESTELAVTSEDVVKALSRLGTLVYQQRQMIKDGEVLPLLEQLVASRQSSDWMFMFGSVAFGVNFLMGLLGGQLNWISGIVAILLIVELRRQNKTIREVTTVVRQFAESQHHETPTRETQLVTELRSHHSLTYQQHQILKAGDVVPLAKEIAKVTRRSGRIHFGLMAFSGLAQLFPLLFDANHVTPSGSWTARAWMLPAVTIFLMLGCAVIFSRSQFLRADRLERLIGEYPADLAALNPGAATESDRDSPYRSPQFE